MKTTKGPWKVSLEQDDDYQINIVAPYSETSLKTVACAFTLEAIKETEEEKANAQLIAKAPELLSALKKIASYGEGFKYASNESQNIIDIITIAIGAVRKATDPLFYYSLGGE